MNKELKEKYPEGVSISEAARRTNSCPNKIRKLIEMGEIKPIKRTRVRYTFYLLMPHDLEVIMSWKGKRAKIDRSF